MTMARIYTRTGDRGQSTLLGGVRASKAHPRFEAMGDVDELNAAIGVAMAVQSDPRVVAVLREVQNTLFTVGAELSVAAGKKTAVPRVSADRVTALEAEMEKLDIGEVREFILPRGSTAVATLHYARAVARRAERHAFALAKREKVNPDLLRYLNRLSSLLFMMAVWVQRNAGIAQEHPKYSR